MSENSEHSSEKQPDAFVCAPEWNKRAALAKYDFLQLAQKTIEEHEAERGRIGAVNWFLHHFNNHLIGEDIRLRLRRKRVCLRTFYRWQKAYQESGIPGLLEGYNNGGCRVDPEVREMIEYLICKNHLARYMDIFLDLQLKVEKSKIPSYSSVRDYVKHYREENWASLVLMHEGKKGLRDRNMEVSLGRRDEDLTQPNERWEIDSTLADLMTERKVKDVHLKTSDGKRCKVIGVIDVFSRAGKFYLVEKETGFMVGQVLKDRILSWGLPQELIIDNGKGYKNHRVLSFLRSVGTAVHICIPGNPIEKPHIERLFRTLTEQLFRLLEGYTGNCIANRPNEIEVKYTMPKLQEIIDRWTTNIYTERIHRSTGQRPRERLSPPGFVPKTVNERDLDILLFEEKERTVRQGRIIYNGGLYYHKNLPEGRRVKIRVNDFDASEILVYSDGKHLCTAEDIKQRGYTPTERQEAKKERNREHRTRTKAHEALLSKYDPFETGILAQIKAAEKKKPLPFPRKVEQANVPDLERDREEAPLIQEEVLITNAADKYLDVMRRKSKGEALCERDRIFLKEFVEDDHYQRILPSLDEQLRGEREVGNA